VTLQGTIVINGGTLEIGSSAGNGGLHYDKAVSFVPRLDIQSGVLTVYGSMTYKSGSASDPINFSMSGGTLNLNTGSAGSPDPLFKINDVSGSVFSMSDGTIVFQKPNITGTSTSDFAINGSAGTVSVGGGLLQFGNSSTANGAAFNFTPVTGVNLPNIRVTSNGTNAVSLAPSQNSTAAIQCISIYVDVNTTFDIQSISGSTDNSRNLTLTGNMDGINSLYNDGTFNHHSGTLLMQGNEGQQIAGNSNTTIYNLTMNNTYGGLLGASINVSGTLSLTNGVLYCTSSNQVTLLAGATTTLGSSVSYIDGPITCLIAASGTSSINFPIGKDGFYRPVSMQVTHSNSSSVAYDAELFNTPPDGFNYTMPGTIDLVSKVRYVSVNRAAIGNFTSGSITLSYDADDGVTDSSNLRVANDDGATGWVDLNGTATADGTGTVTSGYFSSINSKFTLANKAGGTNPLPVDLVSFKAELSGKAVLLNWTTASEKNSDYFEVQKSMDGVSFEKIAKITAMGNSTVMHQDRIADPNLPDPGSYYRLKQLDFDGTATFSSVVFVSNKRESNPTIFPNPVTANSFTLSNVTTEDVASIKMIDPLGHEVAAQKTINNNGSITITTNGHQSGIYYLQGIAQQKKVDMPVMLIAAGE
jgi:hypothetical protein